MRAVTLSELCEPLSASLCGVDRTFSGVSTDSRQVGSSDLFVALVGERFDGHDYLPQVKASGGFAALVSEPESAKVSEVEGEASLSCLRVDDTQYALGMLGAYNRGLYSNPLVAITGSSGKTTVKNMVAAVLSGRGHTLATAGNFNNEIGVPLTLLRLNTETVFAVVEMGAAKEGDIRYLCELARPTIALLLNAMPAHLEGFGSVNDVANAKGEIFDALGAGNVAIVNADQPWANQWRRRAGDATVLDYGLDSAAAIGASAINLRGVHGSSFTASTPSGDISIRLALPGRHNVANALAAIAVGLACELSLTEIRDGLESLRPVPGRLCATQTKSGATIVDDSYNANPGSVRAAIELLAATPGQRYLLLGTMGELGQESERHHAEIGAYARELGIEHFWGVGPALESAVKSFGASGRYFPSREECLAALPLVLTQDDTVLVKGSRTAAMEQIFHALLDQNQKREG